MIHLPSTIPNLSPYWKSSLENIGKFMERRNLTFQHHIEKGVYLYQNNELGTPYFLILVFHDKLGIEHLKLYLHLCENTIVENIIMIYQKSITSNCLKVIENLFQYHLETFPLENFLYDIRNLYYFVPHEKITDESLLLEIKQKYGSNLPNLMKSDPIVKYYGFKRNDVIRIIRSENEIIYRQVR